MTVTLLNAIANALYSGLKKIPQGIRAPAAIGIRITLYAKAQNKLSLTLDITFLEICRPATALIKSPLISIISAVSIATSVPVPMAIPTSDFDNEGASFIPSPINETILQGLADIRAQYADNPQQARQAMLEYIQRRRVKGSWNYRHYSLREYNRTRGISRNNNILFIQADMWINRMNVKYITD